MIQETKAHFSCDTYLLMIHLHFELLCPDHLVIESMFSLQEFWFDIFTIF